jgi:phytoene dehydrogenase-like protein
MENWGNGDRARYMELKKTAMGAMIGRMSSLIPGLEGMIEFRDAATPLTYERYTHNSGGATSSWNWNPKKNFFRGNMSVNIETPVRNLLIGSCWAMPIGGIPGALAAAYMCAKKIR